MKLIMCRLSNYMLESKVVTMVKITGGLFSNSVCSRICFERGVINESSVTIIHWQDIRLYEYFP